LKLLSLKKIVVPILFMSLASGCASVGKPKADIGQQLFVACNGLSLHQKPSGYSAVKRDLLFSQKVDVMDLAGFYQTSTKGSDEAVAAWAKVKVAGDIGFVSTRCLVSQKLLKKQDANRAKLKANQQNTNSAGRGFSDDEEGDLVAMGGAAGKAKSGKADYKKIDKALKHSMQGNSSESLKNFRKKGALGEFKL